MRPTAIMNGIHPGKLPVDSEIYLIADDLLQARAADEAQTPLLCFPRTERGVIDFEEITGKGIDRFVNHAAIYYKDCGVQPIQSSQQTPRVIALLAYTDLAYIVTFFALARLGYTILCLSPRLAPIACVKLIEETGAFAVIPGKTAQLTALVSQIQGLQPVKAIKKIQREDFDKSLPDQPRLRRENVDRETEANWTLAILHSSGSTGLPKPIYLPHRRVMMRIPPPKGQTEFSTFPFFHAYGNWVVVNGLIACKTVYMSNSTLPLTADYVIKVLEHVRPDVLHLVPYTLGLLAGSERGIDAMRKCKRVVFSGSGCPDDLGNELVAKGIRIENFWGATEMGMLGSSFNRSLEDPTWNYIRIPPPVAKFIWMKSLGDDTYECVYLHGLPALVTSNSDDPPKSFHSEDIFLKHPDMDAWKHIGRLGDRLTMTNGEKVLPVPMEGLIRQDPLIKECCIFGNGRSIPGILIFRNEESRHIPDQEFIDAIWPTVQHANTQAESFSQISKETIIPLSADIDYSKTDKESIKRAQIYREFAKEIDAVYEIIENANIGTLQLDIPQIEDWVMRTFRQALGVQLSNSEEDVFAAGVNSLQAIQMRGLILKELDIGGNSRKLSQNVIFDNANVARLSRHLYALRVNGMKASDSVDEIQVMEAMIMKYSTFKKQQVVVITGVTGSLGAYILYQLLNQSDIRHVYCLVRGEKPYDRVLEALQQRSLHVTDTSRLIALTSDFSRADLGLSLETYREIQSSATTIIHSAWAVNFNLGTSSFEDQHIQGVHNLVKLSLSVSGLNPARVFFCSSIAAALATPAPATIPEAPIHDLKAALPQGYARSKLVAEHIVRSAAETAGARTRTLRIGQIVGDGKVGMWNDTEAVPLIIRSALTLRVLPALHETQSWLPVDTLASTILELAGFNTPEPPASDKDLDLVYNLVNHHTFSWTDDLLPELRRSGLSFAIVPANDWLQKLRDYEKNGGDPEQNPAVKLIDHFEHRFAGAKEQAGEIVFESKTAQNHSKALREAPRMIEDGYVKKFVEVWLKKWEGEGKGLEIATSG